MGSLEGWIGVTLAAFPRYFKAQSFEQTLEILRRYGMAQVLGSAASLEGASSPTETLFRRHRVLGAEKWGTGPDIVQVGQLANPHEDHPPGILTTRKRPSSSRDANLFGTSCQDFGHQMVNDVENKRPRLDLPSSSPEVIPVKEEEEDLPITIAEPAIGEGSRQRSPSPNPHSENLREERPPPDPFERLISQHQDLQMVVARRGADEMPLQRSENINKAPSISSSSGEESSDSDAEGLSLAQLAIQMERQRHRFIIFTDKARRASRRIARLTRLLERAAGKSASEVSPRSTINGRSPRSKHHHSSQILDTPVAVQAGPSEGHPEFSSPQGSSRRQTKSGTENDRHESSSWQPETKRTICTLYNFNRRKVGEFTRKPRSLLLPPENPGPVQDTVIASTLDGHLHLFDQRGKSQFQSVLHDELRNYWSEDIAWVSPNVLAVAAADKSAQSSTKGDKATIVPHQLALLYDCSVKRGKFTYKVQHLRNNMPHDRGIALIYPFANLGNKTRWLTGGMDKKIFLWSFDGSFSGNQDDYTKVNHISIHTEHTSAVQGIYYNPHSEVLYSGGLDSRLVGWSLTEGRNTLPFERMEGKIRDISGIPTHPQLLLLGFAESKNQMRLWDERQRKVVLTFGVNEGASEDSSRSDSTKYRHHSVHPNGYLVSLGHIRDGTVAIWDMRHTGVQQGPAQSLSGHTKRVIVAKFNEWRGKSSIISLGLDNSLVFTDYQLRTEEMPKLL
ncbi:hypothetical protein SpCBS45565_g03338 [Spizellomyces sp. 'palustris']|nr:hypothetical protein SpCBS45565_g03338 [Spizellomyces sp. 'palustris']